MNKVKVKIRRVFYKNLSLFTQLFFPFFVSAPFVSCCDLYQEHVKHGERVGGRERGRDGGRKRGCDCDIFGKCELYKRKNEEKMTATVYSVWF